LFSHLLKFVIVLRHLKPLLRKRVLASGEIALALCQVVSLLPQTAGLTLQRTVGVAEKPSRGGTHRTIPLLLPLGARLTERLTLEIQLFRLFG